ncbi:MAG: aminoacyl-tRNA hydrolase [Clostridium sp.]|nr:aminoacyl-tRNA hydrolase [Clostridium sp.]
MFVIAGLGNPGRKYENTRHNVGFCVIDRLADKYGISVNEKMFQALVGRGVIEGEKVLLVKPQTFMNLSGESIQPILGYYKVDPEDFVVVYDDISLEPGNIRVRGKGSAGGHNGIKNIIARLGTQEFPRVRIGTGEKPSQMDLADYVLGHFTSEEQKLMAEAYEAGASACVTLMQEGVEMAMNHFNGKARKQDPDKNGKHEKHEKKEEPKKQEIQEKREEDD